MQEEPHSGECGSSFLLNFLRQKVGKAAKGGKLPAGRVFLSYFLCVGDRRKDLIGLCEVVVFVRCFEVCRTSKLPGKRTSCHFLHRAKSNQKARGTPSCDLDSNRRSIRFEAKVTGVHQVTGNTENCKSPGIAGNDLNRCDAPALQRKDLERSEKEELYSSQTVG